MSDIPNEVLLDWFPRGGFHWRHGQGSPRILRSSLRDVQVQRALIDVLGSGGIRVRKRDVQPVVVGALAAATDAINDPSTGIRPGEGIIDFLERSAKLSELGQALTEDVWVELVYQIASARREYKRYTTAAQQEGDKDQLTALAHAVDDLVLAAGNKWDWMSVEFYTYSHLMGEEDVDYEIDDDNEIDDDDNVAGEEAKEKPAEEELPRRMEQLEIRDGDGDVEMGDM